MGTLRNDSVTWLAEYVLLLRHAESGPLFDISPGRRYSTGIAPSLRTRLLQHAGDLVMTKVESIEREVRDLSAFAEFDAAEWDRQLEEDVASGKLDRLADAALADHNAGRSRTL